MSRPIDVRHYGTAGPLVVLLHGGPGGPGYLVDLARDLADCHRVLEPLQRLSGDVPLTVARHVADLAEVLKGQNETVHLVGHSWGAMLALTYAARRPEDIQQIVLVGSGTFDERSRNRYQEEMQARTGVQDREMLRKLELQLGSEVDPARRNAIFAQKCDIAVRLQAFDPIAWRLPVNAYDELGYRETWGDAMRLQREGVQPKEFQSVTAPVLMLHGKVDPHPGSMIYESLIPFVRDIQYHEFARCGHTPWQERQAREEFLAVLRSALARFD